jgi:predicted 2-oxoglutarate/Fe(II)-dependent dioxygenase YbiX
VSDELLNDVGAIHLRGVVNARERTMLIRAIRDAPGDVTTPYNEQGTAREASPDFVRSHTSFGIDWMQRMITGAVAGEGATVEAFFARPLELNPELHFLTYHEGGYIRAHKDVILPTASTKPLEKISERLVVFSIFLNDDYEGGSFYVHAGFPRPPLQVPAHAGDMVAFVSHLTHGVQTITKGTRYAVSGWFRAPTKERRNSHESQGAGS